MKKMLVLASVVAATFVGSAVAQAGCTQAHMNNKSWVVTMYDVQGSLWYCKFRTSGAGTIAGNATGCRMNETEMDTDFSNSGPIELFDGTIALVPGKSCTYEATIRLLSTGALVIKGRVVFETGKTIANGGYLMSFNIGAWAPVGGGTISMMRQ